MEISNGKLFAADMVHPLEHEVMLECQRNALFDWIAKQSASVKMRLTTLAEATARNYPVTKATAPRLYRLYRMALERLGCKQEYALFVVYGYELVAKTYGSKSDGYVILLNSACLEEFSDGELLAVLGHELGHILADHIQTLELLRLLEQGVKTIPLAGTFAGKQLWTYFAKWMIASEYTADRAAVFASGSARAVNDMILKQIGVSPDNESAKNALTQKVPQVEKLGMYFIWLLQSMPVFGGVKRVKELYDWTRSDEFKADYPFLYYQTRLDTDEPPKDANDERLLRLHKRALQNDASASAELSRLYLRGEGGLPKSGDAAVPLLKHAANAGDAQAMHELALCMKHGVGGLRDDADLIKRLIAASASRGYEKARQNAERRAPQERPAALVSCLSEFAVKYPGNTKCAVNSARPGEPLNASVCAPLASARNAFWMDGNAEVYALELYSDAENNVTGLAIARDGLYGRLSAKAFPFYVPWSLFAGETLTQRETDEGIFLFCGKQAIARKGISLSGTAIEILLRVKKSL